jgi:hypothetical protein
MYSGGTEAWRERRSQTPWSTGPKVTKISLANGRILATLRILFIWIPLVRVRSAGSGEFQNGG